MLPDAPDREWLIAELALLVERYGPEPLIARPLIEPTPAYFPDRWTPDRAGVARLIGRLLRYADLGELRVELDLDAAPPAHVELAGAIVSARHSGAPAWFSGIDERGVARFGCLDAHLGEPEVLVAHLCHEVAHAWREHHRAGVADRDEEELLTDLTTVYLGFGVFTVNASFRFRTASAGTASSWSTHRSGTCRRRTSRSSSRRRPRRAASGGASGGRWRGSSRGTRRGCSRRRIGRWSDRGGT